MPYPPHDATRLSALADRLQNLRRRWSREDILLIIDELDERWQNQQAELEDLRRRVAALEERKP